MTFNLDKLMTGKSDIGLLVLRLFLSVRLIYGVIDNIVRWEKMEEFAAFLQKFEFPFPLASAIISVYVQFLAAVCLLIGYKTRWAALILVLNFIVALVMVHFKIGDTVEGMTPALAMLFGSFTLLCTGAGKYSLDGRA